MDRASVSEAVRRTFDSCRGRHMKTAKSVSFNGFGGFVLLSFLVFNGEDGYPLKIHIPIWICIGMRSWTSNLGMEIAHTRLDENIGIRREQQKSAWRLSNCRTATRSITLSVCVWRIRSAYYSRPLYKILQLIYNQDMSVGVKRDM